MLSRCRQHPLEQVAVAGLEIVLIFQNPAGFGDAIGERIANPLELIETGDAGLARAGRDPGVDGDAGKGLCAKT